MPSIIERCQEWLYMDTLRPPMYICLRRKASDIIPMVLDGRLDKEEWSHIPWSDPFVDIEGPKNPKDHPLTRFKMMYDDLYVYIGAECMEDKIWGTITKQNSTMYHENDFEIFINPDGTRHFYYELEMNCLNTIWELILKKPYRDGYDIMNPFNLQSTHSKVYIDGKLNDPSVKSVKWTLEVRFALQEIVQLFDQQQQRNPPQMWRMNFSRVQYHLTTTKTTKTKAIIEKEKTQEKDKYLIFIKDPTYPKEENIVWAPTGVIDIHRPEKWGCIFFAKTFLLTKAKEEFQLFKEKTLDRQLFVEKILDTIFYQQRLYFQKLQKYTLSLQELSLLLVKKQNQHFCFFSEGFFFSTFFFDHFQLDQPFITSMDINTLTTYTATIRTLDGFYEWSISNEGKLTTTVVLS